MSDVDFTLLVSAEQLSFACLQIAFCVLTKSVLVLSNFFSLLPLKVVAKPLKSLSLFLMT